VSVLVDTSVWSTALRRGTGKVVVELESMITRGQAAIIGPIRQETLQGFRDHAVFERVRERLRPFRDMNLLQSDFEQAAHFYNLCRSRGIQGSNVDFLLCAVAVSRMMPIFTSDLDFRRYAQYLPIKLHPIA
jgi:predicted nucleic acid-binding protein